MPLTAEQKRLNRARDRELAAAGEPAAKKRREDEARRRKDSSTKATEERDTKNAKRKLDRPLERAEDNIILRRERDPTGTYHLPYAPTTEGSVPRGNLFVVEVTFLRGHFSPLRRTGPRPGRPRVERHNADVSNHRAPSVRAARARRRRKWKGETGHEPIFIETESSQIEPAPARAGPFGKSECRGMILKRIPRSSTATTPWWS